MRQLCVKQLLAVPFAAALLGCEPAAPPVSFSAEVMPIIERHCLECHRPEAGQAGYEASGFSMESYAAVMRGTRYGPMVIPGDSLSSALTMLIEGRADPSIAMPHGDRPKLKPHEIDTIKAWVEQGARDN